MKIFGTTFKVASILFAAFFMRGLIAEERPQNAYIEYQIYFGLVAPGNLQAIKMEVFDSASAKIWVKFTLNKGSSSEWLEFFNGKISPQLMDEMKKALSEFFLDLDPAFTLKAIENSRLAGGKPGSRNDDAIYETLRISELNKTKEIVWKDADYESKNFREVESLQRINACMTTVFQTMKTCLSYTIVAAVTRAYVVPK